ncbi:MAG TPA: hypothetical protein GXX37_13680 [Clostridiaceae bacterium]|nr:hypothetical protein [Clostridiaceae bacterium]
MIVIIFKDIKKKVISSLVMVLLWATIYFSAGVIFQNIFMFNLSIGNLFSFSCPSHLEIHNIFINDRVDDAITVSSNISQPERQKFSTYTSLKGKFSFKYPSAFSVIEKEFPGSEILYHIDFSDNQNVIHGLVQVWEIPYSLNDFLNNSKETSNLEFKSFKSAQVKVDDKDGYLWDYVIYSNDNNTYKALEYFFEKEGRIYRVSMFAPEAQWSKADENTFWKMVKSFEVRERKNKTSPTSSFPYYSTSL